MEAVLLPCGDSAVLVELPSLPAVLGLHAALTAKPLPGVVELVPGASTLLVVGDPGIAPPAVLADWVRGTSWEPRMPEAASAAVELPVRYDGPDLAAVAALLAMSEEAVVALHAGSVWTAAFGGFAPGFAYLVTDHDRLVVPRRPEARVAVPAGAVGLAGPFSGVYPRASPGGWQLLGTTDAVLWDADRGALLAPGTPVRFRAVGR